MRAVRRQATRIAEVPGRRAVRGQSRGRDRTARARRARQRRGRMPVVRRLAAWGPGILGPAVLACGIRGRTGRVRKVRQRTIRMPAVLGPAARRPGVLGRTVRRRGRPGRTAGVLGRRTVRARRARQRPTRRAGDREQGMAGGPAAPGKHAVLGRGSRCRNEAGGQARWGHLLPGYAVRVRGGPGPLVRGRIVLGRGGRARLAARACRGLRRAVLRRAVLGHGGPARLAVRACRGPRRAVLGHGSPARLAARACRGPGRERGGRGQGGPGPVVPARGVLACRGPGRERGGRGRIAVLLRWRQGRLRDRRWAGRGKGARAGGQAAARRRLGPGARADPLMAFPQQ
jgi:hypothetical protein